MKQHSGILTAWLAMLIIYNAAQAIQWTSISAVMFWVGQQVDSQEAKEALEKRNVTQEELATAINASLVWCVAYVLARLASVAFLTWLFFWKKIAFWCYGGSAAAVFAINSWGGDTPLEASIDLIGLAILVALFHVVEPNAWRQLE